MEHQQGCQEISRVQEAGITTKVTLLIGSEAKSYVITVATPTYLDRLRGYNQGFPDEEQLDDLAYSLDPIPDTEEELCGHLTSLSNEILSPYLVEQKIPKIDTI